MQSNIFQAMYEDKPVEIVYTYDGKEVVDAWIRGDHISFNINKIYVLAVEHHKKTLL